MQGETLDCILSLIIIVYIFEDVWATPTWKLHIDALHFQGYIKFGHPSFLECFNHPTQLHNAVLYSSIGPSDTYKEIMEQTVELLVRMNCNGCDRAIRKALRKLKGIDEVEIDREQQKVTVIGHVDRMKVLTTVRKTGKAAEFWNPLKQPDYHLYATTAHVFSKTYNYEKHGYNILPGVEEEAELRVETLFSDENPNACSMM